MENLILTGINVNELLQRIGQLIDSKFKERQPENKTTKQSDFITRSEVAKLLKISLPTLYYWTKDGLLKAYRIRCRVLYKREEVENALLSASLTKYKKGVNHAS